MYAAIAAVVDRIQKDTPPAEVPRAVVDDAAEPGRLGNFGGRPQPVGGGRHTFGTGSGQEDLSLLVAYRRPCGMSQR
ncbi:hypothetical protein ACLQ2L_41725 [Streptomyces sp. DT203]